LCPEGRELLTKGSAEVEVKIEVKFNGLHILTNNDTRNGSKLFFVSVLLCVSNDEAGGHKEMSSILADQ
jgi:hypothetical protein